MTSIIAYTMYEISAPCHRKRVESLPIPLTSNLPTQPHNLRETNLTTLILSHSNPFSKNFLKKPPAVTLL